MKFSLLNKDFEPFFTCDDLTSLENKLIELQNYYSQEQHKYDNCVLKVEGFKVYQVLTKENCNIDFLSVKRFELRDKKSGVLLKTDCYEDAMNAIKINNNTNEIQHFYLKDNNFNLTLEFNHHPTMPFLFPEFAGGL